jgi:hypothetical protein
MMEDVVAVTHTSTDVAVLVSTEVKVVAAETLALAGEGYLWLTVALLAMLFFDRSVAA